MNVATEDKVKYETNNPISKFLLKNFMRTLEDIMNSINFSSVYEAGCGSGYITRIIRNGHPLASITAIDIEDGKLFEAKKQVSNVDFSVGSIYETHQCDASFDLVISTEVLEHLDKPEMALKELIRISKRYIIISVPNEPIWRICNMMRFKYLRRLGNTPGHIQHWDKRQIKSLVIPYCDICFTATPFPWIMLLLEKRKN